MARKKATKREALQSVPQSREELAEAVARIGSLKRKINQIISNADEDISQIQERVDREVAPITQELDDVLDGIHAYAESNRDNLTQAGKVKTVKLATGKLFWRTTPPKVNIRKIDDLIETLKKMGLERFIRTKEEPDKTAMLKERKAIEGVKGVSITQQEEFVVEPSELELELVKKISSSKKSRST